MKIERIQQPDASKPQARSSEEIEANSKETMTSNAVSFNQKKKDEREKKQENPEKQNQDEHLHISSRKPGAKHPDTEGIDVIA
ncbi:hypothetical protein OAO01_04800 [Oligoflexia bacterium]|nr:hypothetical protein [Oligoflexia bacterium]